MTGAVEAPLGYEQERLWQAWRASDGRRPGPVRRACWLTGPVDPGALQLAVDTVVERHAALRTGIVADGTPRQVVVAALRAPIDRITVSGPAPGPRAEAVAAELAQRPFELSRAPLLRVALIQVGPERHLFVLVVHRLAADEVSADILLQELSTVYSTTAGALPERWLDFPDFAWWQRDRMSGAELVRQRDYWLGQLAGATGPGPVPEGNPAGDNDRAPDERHTATLSPTVTAALAALADEPVGTPGMAVLAAFTLVLSGYGQQPEVVLAVTEDGRTHEELGPLVGAFAQPVPLRIGVPDGVSFGAHLTRVREAYRIALAHQELPFGVLAEALASRRGSSQPPLIRVGFVEYPGTGAVLRLPGCAAYPMVMAEPPTDLDLTLSLRYNGSSATLGLSHRPLRGTPGWGARLLEELAALLDRVAEADYPEPIAARLSAIWSQLLPDNPTVAPTDSLFLLGANSLHVIRFVGRVAEEFDVVLAAHQVFDQPTVAELAATVAALRAGRPDPPAATVEPVAVAEPVAMAEPDFYPELAQLSDAELDDLLRAAQRQRERRGRQVE